MVRDAISHLDLNLLIPLDALLSERSVTRAADRLGLTQPALSGSLARLRSHFGDPILTRHGSGYRLTPLAARLAEPTAVMLESARRLLASEAAFDPATSVREFVILGSDYAFATIGSRVSAASRAIAPDVRFRFVLHTPAIVDDAMEALRTVDGILLPHDGALDLPHLDVYSDDWVCVVSADNPAVGDELTPENLRDLPWVFTHQNRISFISATRQLEMTGITPNVDVIVEDFLVMPYFIAGTDRIGLVQSGLLPQMLGAGDLRALPAPFAPIPLTGALWWHPLHHADASHRWIRQQFELAAIR